MLNAVHHEWTLLCRVLPGSPPPSALIHATLECILAPALDQYAECSEALLNRVKKSMAQHDFTAIFILFDVLETFLAFMGTDESSSAGWQEAMRHAGKRSNDLNRIVHDFASLALKSFGEFLDDVRTSKVSSLPDDGTVHELSSNSVMFLRRLCDKAPTVEMLLDIIVGNNPAWSFQPDVQSDWMTLLIQRRRRDSPLGSQESLANEGDPVEKEAESDTAIPRPAMQRFIKDAVTLLCVNLETKSKGYTKKPSDKTPKSILATLFLLNNFHFTLKSLRSHTTLFQIAGSVVESSLEKRMRDECDFYLISWTHLVAPLNDLSIPNTDLNNHDRQALKDKFKTFNADFEDAQKVQSRYTVPDPELRQQLVRDIKAAVMSVYSRFWARYSPSGFTSNPEKYLKYDSNTVELMLSRLFDPVSQ
jgi:hypothetical protein